MWTSERRGARRQRPAERGRRRIWLSVAAVSCAAAAVAAAEWNAGPTRDRHVPAAASDVHEALKSFDQSRPSFLERFTAGFHDLSEQVCESMLPDPQGGGKCTLAAALGGDHEQAEARLERAMDITRPAIRPWLRAIGAIPLFPRHAVAAATEFVAREARGPDAPFTTVVALEVIRWAPILGRDSFLASVARDPPGGYAVLTFSALDALAASPRARDVPFLEASLRNEDTRVARRALRGLARAPGGAEEIARYLRERGGRLDPSVARELPEALQDSRLVGDEEVQLLALQSDEPRVVLAALRSVSWGESGRELPTAVVDRIAAIAGAPGITTDAKRIQREAISALGHLGPIGSSHLEHLLESGELDVAERLYCADLLWNSPERAACGAALDLLLRVANVSDAALVANVVARDPSLSESLVDGLQRWLREHPTERDALEEALSNSRSDALQAVLERVFADG